ncbi:hypothetical protein CMO96_01755 [Candidatus Woesebacteria bacterium]|nr:hypothetical protein [Candidatus Woesebacteria bacterium]|tara:strand:+ start:1143 stop:1763 length:621 start_codon:yes stop_codon:yes gene_type:complete
MRNLFYLLTFVIVAPITLVTSLFSLNALARANSSENIVYQAQPSQEKISAFTAPRYGSRVYAALPGTIGQVAGVATAKDARIEITKQYLEKYNSPLLGYEEKIIEESDKKSLDFRLLTAIAQQESNLCKKIPSESYNCWGWGIHSKGTLRFNSFGEAIEEVSRGLREEYFNKGFGETPEEIMKKWVPHSPEGSWAKGVNQFILEME